MALKRVPLISLAILLLSVVLAACSSASRAQPDQITVRLGWLHNGEYAGMYMADEKGFYTEENLAVTLVPADPAALAAKDLEVLEGRAQFGVTSADAILLLRAQGKDPVAVAAIYRSSPLIVMALESSGIKQIQDLAGKRIGVLSPAMDSTWELQFLGMLRQFGVDPSTMSFVQIEDFHSANELTSGRVDAVTSFYSTNEPVVAKLEGHEVVSLFYSDYGIVNYTNPIFTTQRLIESNPDLVRRFIRATLKGYQYAIEHPDEGARGILKYNKDANMVSERGSMDAQIPLIDTGDAPIGTMDDKVWQSIHQDMIEYNIISPTVPLEGAFTNEFITPK
jgi:NitT/TauT family transport system substrate-binding protein